MTRKPFLLCILDGFGINNHPDHNAIYHAKTPVWDGLKAKFPMSKVDASGTSVGLPNGQMGNSEVGHLNIGAGRIVTQLLPLINHSLQNGDVLEKSVLIEFINKTKNANNVCHLMGLASDGGVHGDIEHIIKLAEILADNDIYVKIHSILDGRDTAPTSALNFIKHINRRIDNNPKIELVTVSGRYFTMDRDNNWDRVVKSYNNMVNAEGNSINNFDDYIENNYSQNVTDEFIEPAFVSSYNGIKSGDSFCFANFRADRARQISNALFSENFQGFKRQVMPQFAASLSMAEYSEELSKILPCLFPIEMPQNTISDVIANAGLKQLHIAETEKYAHVTFFFNGGVEKEKPGEDRILIPSPNVATFDLKPEMSAGEVTDQLVEAINSLKYDFIVVNYANADMVGHTGNFEAAIKAVEFLDHSIAKVSNSILANDGHMIITADHGNIEQMFDEKQKQKHTAHTMNLVPFMLLSNNDYKLIDGKLCDIAPTVLDIMNLNKPSEMTGKSLIIDND
ncbi:MAG: 2,3-bisphosphoglycerate-independent phosphoglycerate mutase [Rickettsiales bacterium]|nr:2,3-bisphosphoglycerate-independent phosphoglycerate mutase [Rickettsiales bacterium]